MARQDQLRAEPQEQAGHDRGGADRDRGPQAVGHSEAGGAGGAGDAARDRPGRHDDKAGRSQEHVRQRPAMSGPLGVRRDGHGSDADGHQDHAPGQRRRPERQPGHDVAGSHSHQGPRHQAPVHGTHRRQGADGVGHRIVRARLHRGRCRRPRHQQGRRSGRRDHAPPRHAPHDTTVRERGCAAGVRPRTGRADGR